MLAGNHATPEYTIREDHALAILLAQGIGPCVSLILEVHVLLAVCIDNSSPLRLRHRSGQFYALDICSLFLE